VKGTSFFLLGIVAGVVGVVAIERLRREHAPEDADLLSRRVAEHLRQLEERLESAMRLKTQESA